MPAGLARAQTLVSFAANATLSAYRIVTLTAANQVGLHLTATAYILGVTTQDSSGGTGTSVVVALAGTAKVACAASVSAGAILTAQTATGLAVEATITDNTTTSTVPVTLGHALMAGSTNSVIEVWLNQNNLRKQASA